MAHEPPQQAIAVEHVTLRGVPFGRRIRGSARGGRDELAERRERAVDVFVEAHVIGAQRVEVGRELSLRFAQRREVVIVLDLVVPVQVGQQVAPGTNLARVADPTRLKAELRIAETQARDLTIGQIAQVDTRNGLIPGKVIRIDPAAQNGTVTVDIQLEGELPRGARPDLSVDGTVELERLDNVLYVGRPAFGQEQSTVGLFKLDPNGEASRVQVQLGRSSVNTIEVVAGLAPGDQVVLSDMSAWDAFDRVQLN